MPNLIRWLSICAWVPESLEREEETRGKSVSFEQRSTERFVVPFLYIIQNKTTTKFQNQFL